ncbi:UNVERIFIED_CONTAM: hypothetical protein FKN15_070894 [Acipenser sinensis]
MLLSKWVEYTSETIIWGHIALYRSAMWLAYCGHQVLAVSLQVCKVEYKVPNMGQDRDGICRSWGQHHYESFDGIYYYFPGTCSYILAKDCHATEPQYTIWVHNSRDCDGSVYSCHRSLSLFFPNKDEIHIIGHDVKKGGIRLTLPLTIGNVFMERLADYILVKSTFGFSLAWDGSSGVYIKMTEEHKGRPCGLCGNYNDDGADDLTTSYNVQTEDTAHFGNSWVVQLPSEAPCHPLEEDFPGPCSSESAMEDALEKCTAILFFPFVSCHENIDPNPYVASCASDLCVSGDDDTFCRAVTEYTRACSHAGYPVREWRESFPACTDGCEDSFVHRDCISCCPPTCTFERQCLGSNLHCLDGCYCPDGLIMENGSCISVANCPCVYHGTSYPLGYVLEQGCSVCICSGGLWNCTENNCTAECSVTGHTHIPSFDGRIFMLIGTCQYVLVKSWRTTRFTLTLQNMPCGEHLISWNRSGDDDTFCRAVTEFTRACSHAGYPVREWRESFPACTDGCEDSFVHRDCISCCPPTCTFERQCLGSNLHCLDGCYCPDGLIMENGSCISVANCPCVYHGTSYPLGYVLEQGCSVCLCSSFTLMSVLVQSLEHSCIQSITLVVDEDVSRQVTLTKDGEVLIGVNQAASLPYSDGDVVVSKVTSLFTQLKTSFGLRVQFDRGGGRLYVQVESSWEGGIVGLCGTFNGNLRDDFLSPSGMIEGTPQLHANAWKVSAACTSPVNIPIIDPCEMNQQNVFYASQCDIVNEGLFSPCHSYVSPSVYFQQCRYQACKCGSNCLCTALAHYAYICAKHKVFVNFRAHVSECGMVCLGGMMYHSCTSTCGKTCLSLSNNEACDDDCAEGCNCVEGLYYDEARQRCVAESQCHCYFMGAVYQSGEVFFSASGPCLCRNGRMECAPEEPEPDPGECPPGKTYFNCRDHQPGQPRTGIACEVTCRNLMLNLTCPPATPCVRGCGCPAGLVRHKQECYFPESCPCAWLALEYLPGEVVSTPCYKCVCHRGFFNCTHYPCPSVCTVYSDRHYHTFDGLEYDYVSDCQVYLVKSINGTEVSITAQNKDCYESGIICMKYLVIFVGLTKIYFTDNSGDPSSSSVIGKGYEFQLWKAGYYTVVHFPKQEITILWDKKTTVHIQAGPEWKGLLTGMCGNFDKNTVNDMTTASNMEVSNAQALGDSWALGQCESDYVVKRLCEGDLIRQPYAKRECAILYSDAFASCHNVVDVTWFYKNCLTDTCNCNRGGDCECLCTSIAAYAHKCCQQGVAVNWRSPTVCSYDCEFYNRELGDGPYIVYNSAYNDTVFGANLTSGEVFPLPKISAEGKVLFNFMIIAGLYKDRYSQLGDGPYIVYNSAYNDTVFGANLTSGEVFPLPKISAEGKVLFNFMIIAGLYKDRYSRLPVISFESAERPNYFLCASEDGSLRLEQWSASEKFRRQATYFHHQGLGMAGYSSFELYSQKGFFITLTRTAARALGYDYSEEFKHISSFTIEGIILPPTPTPYMFVTKSNRTTAAPTTTSATTTDFMTPAVTETETSSTATSTTEHSTAATTTSYATVMTTTASTLVPLSPLSPVATLSTSASVSTVQTSTVTESPTTPPFLTTSRITSALPTLSSEDTRMTSTMTFTSQPEVLTSEVGTTTQAPLSTVTSEVPLTSSTLYTRATTTSEGTIYTSVSTFSTEGPSTLQPTTVTEPFTTTALVTAATIVSSSTPYSVSSAVTETTPVTTGATTAATTELPSSSTELKTTLSTVSESQQTTTVQTADSGRTSPSLPDTTAFTTATEVSTPALTSTTVVPVPPFPLTSEVTHTSLPTSVPSTVTETTPPGLVTGPITTALSTTETPIEVETSTQEVTTATLPSTNTTLTDHATYSTVIPSILQPTSTCTPPYSYRVDECSEYICFNGHLMFHNASLQCRNNVSQPNCGILGMPVQINKDNCCPQWECPCRCSIISDLRVITFDGNNVALYDNGSYILVQLPRENIVAHIEKCPTSETPTGGTSGLCFKKLNITTQSYKVLINRLERKVSVNFINAHLPFTRQSLHIDDTGTMYVINTPGGVSIQWYHSTGIIVLQYSPPYNTTSGTRGLCGCCDGNPEDDLKLPNGTVIKNVEDIPVFLYSWMVHTSEETDYFRRVGDNCTTGNCTKCFQMLNQNPFTVCHDKGETHVEDPDFSSACGCTRYFCKKTDVCLFQGVTVLSPGQSVIQYFERDLCYMVHCLQEMDPGSGFHAMDVATVNCSEKCGAHQVYVPSSDPHICCGSCKNVSCTFTNENGTIDLYRAGSTWVSNCTRFDCVESAVGAVVLGSGVVCPPFNDTECMQNGGTVQSYIDGCCKLYNSCFTKVSIPLKLSWVTCITGGMKHRCQMDKAALLLLLLEYFLQVAHFSKYGLQDSDEEDEVPPTKTDAKKLKTAPVLLPGQQQPPPAQEMALNGKLTPLPPGWVPFKSSCYKTGKGIEQWSAAQKSCELSLQRAHLADIETEEEYLFISSYLKTFNHVIMLWIGLNDKQNEVSSCYKTGKGIEQWSAAQKSCALSLQRAHLADIETEEEYLFISSYLKTFNHVIMLWTGLNDKQTEGELRWTDGSAYNLGNVMTSYLPHNETDCYALQMNATGPNYFFTGFFCYIPLLYLCEYEFPSAPEHFGFQLEDVKETEVSFIWSGLQDWMEALVKSDVIIQYQMKFSRVKRQSRILPSNITRMTISGLSPGNLYLFSLTVTSAGGASITLGPILSAETRPNPPLNATVKTITSREIPLYWTAPDKSQGASFDHYLISYVDVQTNTKETLVVENYKTSAVIPSIKPYHPYRISIQTVAAAGSGSCVDASISVITAVSPPKSVSINLEDVGEENVTLQWDPPQEQIDEYYILVRSVTIGGDSTNYSVNNSNSFELSMLTPGMTYEIGVAAVRNGNMSELKTVQQTLRPKRVQIVVPYELNTHSVVLYVQNPLAGIYDGINVTYKEGSQRTPVSVGGDTITIENLTPGTAYDFFVYTTSLNMASAAYQVPAVKTCLAPPTNVREGNTSETSVEIVWDRAEGRLQNYEAICVNCAPTFMVQKVYQERAVFTHLVPGKMYTFSIRSEKEKYKDSIQVFQKIQTVPSQVERLNHSKSSDTIAVSWTQAQHIFDGYIVSITNGSFHKEKTLSTKEPRTNEFGSLSPGSSYIINVVTTSGQKRSIPAIISVTTSTDLVPGSVYNITVQRVSEGVNGVPAFVTVTTVPERPQELQVMNTSSSSFSLRWRTPYGHVDRYQVDLIPDQGFVTVTELGGGELQVAAENSAGSGLFSSSILFKTAESVPGLVTNLTASAYNHTTVKVTWFLPRRPNGLITKFLINVKHARSGQLERKFEINAEEIMKGTLPNCHDDAEFYSGSTPSPSTSSASPPLTSAFSSMTASALPAQFSWTKPIALTVEQLKSYTAYVFEVSAFTNEGEGLIASYMVRMPESVPEDPPQSIAMWNITSKSFTISWDPPTVQTGKFNYRIELYGPSGHIFDNSTRDLKFTYSGLTPYTTYTVFVGAETFAGPGPKTNVTLVTPAEAPSAVNGLKALAVDSTSVKLSWKSPLRPNGIITQYRILVFRKPPGILVQNITLTGKTEDLNDTTLVNDAESTSVLVTNLSAEQMSHVIKTLIPFTEYMFSVAASTDVGEGPSTNIIVKTREQVPSSVQGVYYQNITSTSILVSWKPPTNPNGKITHFTVYGMELLTKEAFHKVTNETSIIISGLKKYTEYKLRVAASTGVGESSLSEEDDIFARTMEDAESTSVLVTNLSAEQMSHVIKTLIPFTEYMFSVAASTDVGEGPSTNIIVKTREQVPSSVQGVYYQNITSTSILVSWEPPTNPNGKITHFTVYGMELLTKEAFHKVTNETSIIISGLKKYTEYKLRVAASTGVGESSLSEEDDIFARTMEDAPFYLQGHISHINIHSTSIPVLWTPSSNPNEIIHLDTIYYSNSSGVYIQVIAWDLAFLASTLKPNGLVTKYQLSVDNNQTYQVFHTEVSVVSVSHNGLRPFTSYGIIISTCTSKGPGPSYSIKVTTAEDSGSVHNLTYQNLSSTTVNVSWFPPTSPNGKLFYHVSLWSPQMVIPISEVTTNKTDLLIEDLQKYTGYILKVTPATAAGFSENTTATLYIRTDEDTPETPPVITTYKNLTASSIQLFWNPPAHPNGNILSYNLLIHGPTGNNSSSTSNTSLILSDLLPSTTYNVSINAETSKGPGPSATQLLYTDETEPSTSPQNLVMVNHTADTVWLRWDPSPEPNGVVQIYSFKIFENNSQTMSYKNTSGLFTDAQLTGFKPHSVYLISVSAFTKAGNGNLFSNSVSFSTNQSVPDAVQNLHCIGTSWQSVLIQWDPPTNSNGIITHYIVQFGGDAQELKPTDHVYTVRGLLANTTYTFRVIAATSAGIGKDQTCFAETLPESVPSAPKDLNITKIQSSSVTLSWTRPDVVPGYLQNYRVVGQLLSMLCNNWNTSGCIENKVIQYVSGTDDSLETSIYSLLKFRRYRFSVAASTNAGYGNSTDWISTNTLPGNPDTPPQNVTAVSRSYHAIAISWRAPEVVTGPTAYLIDVTSVDSQDYNRTFMKRDEESKNIELSDLTPFTRYSVIVIAFTGDVDEARIYGKASAPVIVITLQDTPKDPPKNVTLQKIPDDVTKVYVMFSPPSEPNGDIQFYRAVVCKEEDPTDIEILDLRIIENNTDTLTAVIEGLKGGHTYNISVYAVNGAGPGPKTELKITMDIQAPPESSMIPVPAYDKHGAAIVTARTMTIQMPVCFFSDSHGPIEKIQVIIAEAKVRNDGNITTWKDAYFNKPRPYFSNKGFENPPCTERMKRQTISVGTYVLGAEDTCMSEGNEARFCNGPLKPKKDYVFKFRATNFKGQYTDSVYSKIVTTAGEGLSSRTVEIILAVALCVLSVILLGAAIYAFARIRQKQKEGGTYSPRDAETIDTKFKLDQLITVADLELKEEKLTRYSSFFFRRKEIFVIQPVNKKSFLQHVEDLCANDNVKFQEEFSELPKLLQDLATSDADLPWNRSKNRFTNIKPYNNNRVKLISEAGVPGSDYINASYMSGYLCPNEFIATQGPLPGTVADFWRMIWETRTRTIAMLTQCFEKGRIRCHQYWPEDNKPVTVFGDIVITKLTEDVHPDWTIRDLKVERHGDCMVVRHFNFTSWPEHGVPESSTALIHFVKLIRVNRAHDNTTIAVHCSCISSGFKAHLRTLEKQLNSHTKNKQAAEKTEPTLQGLHHDTLAKEFQDTEGIPYKQAAEKTKPTLQGLHHDTLAKEFQDTEGIPYKQAAEKTEPTLQGLHHDTLAKEFQDTEGIPYKQAAEKTKPTLQGLHHDTLAKEFHYTEGIPFLISQRLRTIL